MLERSLYTVSMSPVRSSLGTSIELNSIHQLGRSKELIYAEVDSLALCMFHSLPSCRAGSSRLSRKLVNIVSL